MQFYSGCGTPPGGSPTTGGLTFSIAPPYLPVSFCMSAGQPTAPANDTGVVITATPTSGSAASVNPTFRIGVPEITVTPDTFTIPAESSVNVDIALSPPSSTNVFNLPVKVFITGPGSTLTSTGPILADLPPGVSSADCGPGTSGETIPAGGGSVTCTVSSGGTLNSAGNLVVFVTFGPGGGGTVPLGACASSRGVVARCGAQTQRISTVRPQRQDSASSGGASATFGISSDGVQFSPLLPKAGDTVSIRARVENRGDQDAEGVPVSLLINNQTAATLSVGVPAGGSRLVEFQWEAAYDPRLSIAIAVGAPGDSPETVAVRNLFVEPDLAGTLNQGRASLEVSNGNCVGFRFILGSQTFCGGSSDIELSPVITADGQLRVEVLSLNGGIVDLGPRPITGTLEVPESGYAAKGWLEPGRLYAVESQGKYGLLYVVRIQSDIDPRLARLTRGKNPALESLDDLLTDQLNDLLDQARVTVVLEWSYLENGSRRFSYGFSGVERGPRPGVYRQPRTPAGAARQ